MDYNGRRRVPPGSQGGSIPKAIGIGMTLGLILSAAYFVHNRQLDELKGQLEVQLSHHEKKTQAERQMRELAEQLQTEADTERTSIQNKLTEKDGQILVARQELELAKKESQKATDTVKSALDQSTAAAAEKARLQTLNSELEAKAKKLEAELAAAKAAQPQVVGQVGAGLTADRHTPWGPSAERDAKDPELAGMLKNLSRNNEIMVAISNKYMANPDGALDIWSRNIRRITTPNHMVVALDDETEDFCKSAGINVIRMPVLRKEGQLDWISNHAVSAMKFTYLQRFLSLGYSVLLSDVDIIFFQDPFPHLTKDSDVEGMSDGWNAQTAYGYDDVHDDPRMGWARYAHSSRTFCMNSGLFYIRPTEASMSLLKTVVERIDRENSWDQAIFNMELFLPASPAKNETSVTKRILDYYKFMNSKTLYDEVRFNENLMTTKPVSLHLNYHTDKLDRLRAAEAWFVGGNRTALMAAKLIS